MYEWATARARELDALAPHTADLVLLLVQAPLIAAIPFVLLVRRTARSHALPSSPERLESLAVPVIRSSIGVSLASSVLLAQLVWFTLLLYVRIVFALELGRGFIVAASRRGAADFFFSIGPPVGIGVSGWALVELWRARGRVLRIAEEAKRAP